MRRNAAHIVCWNGVPPVATGGTPFQCTVWAALRRIPAGTTTSYGALAASIGRPSAMRAVGLAVGSNPVAIIVPCHRVIGADHSLTGYGGGLPRKRWCSSMKASSSAAAACARGKWGAAFIPAARGDCRCDLDGVVGADGDDGVAQHQRCRGQRQEILIAAKPRSPASGFNIGESARTS